MLCTSIIEGPPLMPDEDDQQEQLRVSPEAAAGSSRRRIRSLIAAVMMLLLVLVMGLFLAFCGDNDWTTTSSLPTASVSTTNNNKNKNGHSSTSTPAVVRTILAIQDPKLGGYVDARNNPVYEDLRTTKILMPKNKNSNGTTKKKGFLAVELNNNKLLPKEDDFSPVSTTASSSSSRSLMASGSSSSSSSLTVSWEAWNVHNDDLLALYCHGKNDNDDERKKNSAQDDVLLLEYSKIIEAATMSQIRYTAAARQHAAKKNKWHIPRIPVTLQRQDNCQFLLLQKKKHQNNNSKNATYYYEIVDESEILEWHRHGRSSNNKNTPMGIHLSLTNSSSSILVHFNTHGNMGTPIVQYGLVVNNPTKKKKIREMDKKEGHTSTYSNHDMCEAPANETGPGQFQDPGFLHTVVLDHLHSNTKYTYRVGFETGQGVTWSPYSNFTTAMEPGQQQKDEDYVFIVYGDQGIPVGRTWELGHHWMVQMEQWEQKAHAIHMVGDLSYARGVAHIWDDWFELLQPVSTSKFYMVGVGNHEYCHHKGGADGKDPSGVTTDAGFHPIWGNMENDSGGECGVPTAQRFTMPQSKNSNGVFWYSYAVGLVHTIVISSEHDLSEGSRLHTWLKQELESIDRKVTPWVIVECHRPLYEGDVDWGQVQVGVGMRYEFEDLLYDYQVDVYLAGHIHAYHRTCDGLYRSQCHQGGPIHFTIGTMGAELVQSEVTAPWTAHALLDTFGYGRFTVANATAMHFEFVQLVDDVNDNATAGTVLDDVWIVRER